MSIEFGEFNEPSFIVTYRSIALWHKGAATLHQQFMDWSKRIGLVAVKNESLSRVDFTFDYYVAARRRLEHRINSSRLRR